MKIIGSIETREGPAEEAVKRWPYFWVAAMSAFMSTLDSSIVNLALPTLGVQFREGVSGVAWVVQSYLLVAMAFLPVGGRLLDLFGPRRVFVAGFVLFTLGSGLCALSGSISMLVASRAFQGLGAAVLLSSNQGLVAMGFPKSQRGRTLGMIGTVVSIGLASGPPLGGVLIQALGWRSIFYLNLPIGIFATYYCLRHLEGAPAGRRRQRFDWIGAALIVCGLASLFLGLDVGADEGWFLPGVVLLVAISLSMLFLFMWNEIRNPAPLMNLALFRNRYFSQSCAASFLAFFAMVSTTILMPFYLQYVLRLNPAGVGLVMTTVPLAMLLVAPLSGWISDLIGPPIPATFGLAILAVGLFLLSRLEVGASVWASVVRLSLIGLGMGFFGSPNTHAILSGAPSRHVGEASGISALMRTSGITFGIAFSVTAYEFFKKGAASFQGMAAAHGVVPDPLVYLTGMRPVFLLAALVTAVNMLNSISRGRRSAGGPAGGASAGQKT